MCTLVEVPQCSICLDPFNRNVPLFRPAVCGHVFCKPCTDRLDNPVKCPFRCQTRLEAAYKLGVEPVFLAFGTHGVDDLHPPEADTDHPVSEYKDVSEPTGATVQIMKLERQVSVAVKLLHDLADTDPETLVASIRKKVSESGNSRWLVFTRAGRVLEKISNLVEDDQIRSMMQSFAGAISKIQSLYVKMESIMMESLSVQKKLRKQKENAESEVAELRKSMQTRQHRYDREINNLKLEMTQSRDKLIQDKTELRKKWKEEQELREDLEMKLEKSQKEVLDWREKSVKHLKKYHALKADHKEMKSAFEREMSSVPTPSPQILNDNIDQSLIIEDEIIGLDGSDVELTNPPPSSGSVLNGIQENRDSDSIASSSRKPTTGYRSTPIPSGSRLVVKRIGEGDRPDSPVENERPENAEDAISKCKWGKSPKKQKSSKSKTRLMEECTTVFDDEYDDGDDIEELLEILPELRDETVARPGTSRMKVKLRPPPSSKDARKAGIPINPLAAARQDPRGFHGPERKKQRLTLHG